MLDKPEIVVDTNVVIVANGDTPQASETCEIACIEKLEWIQDNCILLLDNMDLILKEYDPYFCHSGQPGPGDAFFRWLHFNQFNDQHCRTIAITPHAEREFAEFPDDPDLADFDRSDRKFVAVAIASGNAPEILNATDTDWWQHRAALQRHGIKVTFLCPKLMQQQKQGRRP